MVLNNFVYISIVNYNELISAIDYFNTFNKSIAINYVKKNSGATTKILDSCIM